MGMTITDSVKELQKWRDSFNYDYAKCPKCGWIFEEGDKDWEEPYCCHCGQRLKWF